MESTEFNPDVTDEYQNYLAWFDLSSEVEHRNTVTVTSNDDQTVYISAYLYNSQHHRNGGCSQYKNSSASITVEGYDEMKWFEWEAYHAEGI